MHACHLQNACTCACRFSFFFTGRRNALAQQLLQAARARVALAYVMTLT